MIRTCDLKIELSFMITEVLFLHLHSLGKKSAKCGQGEAVGVDQKRPFVKILKWDSRLWCDEAHTPDNVLSLLPLKKKLPSLLFIIRKTITIFQIFCNFVLAFFIGYMTRTCIFVVMTICTMCSSLLLAFSVEHIMMKYYFFKGFRSMLCFH